jgi:signal transduction histidine kinase
MEKRDVFLRLRLKMMLGILLVQVCILAVLMILLNVSVYFSNRSDADSFMRHLIERGGRMASYTQGSELRDKMVRERLSERGIPFEIANDIPRRFEFLSEGPAFHDYYSVRLDTKGQVVRVYHALTDDSTYKFGQSVVRKALASGKLEGVSDGMGYMIRETPEKDGYIAVVVDCIADLRHQVRFFVFSLVIYVLSLVVTAILSWLVSAVVVHPVKETFERQKQFIADASHELKTPIAVISANVAVLEQEIPDNKWLAYIKTENLRMSSLVKDMLYLAKDDAGRMEYNMLPFDLAEAAASCVMPFESVAYEQGKKLELDIPKSVLPVMGDETKIRQVIIILTDNAIKNSDRDALIRVSAGIENSKCFVKVYNTGHGIAPEDMEKIFNRFYRADSSRDRATGGYGLGLAIAQSIAAGHRGRISVQSKVGAFAEFTLTLPHWK